MLCCLLVEKEFSLHFFLGLTLRGKNVVSTFQPSSVSVGTENSVLTELASLSPSITGFSFGILQGLK